MAPETILSRAGHEESGPKLGGPPSKAKYSWRPIVDKYREGKVKEPREGSEIEPETVSLQAVRGRVAERLA